MIGLRKTSSGVWITPSAPRRTSSKVIGSRSSPGSTTLPTRRVPASTVLLTVMKLASACPPAVPLPSASRKAPSAAARIRLPSTCTVMRAPPGMGAVKNSQAKLPSVAGTMVAASLLPSGPVAYRLLALRVAVLTARLKLMTGRWVTPTSPLPSFGVMPVSAKGASASTVSARLICVALPAASRAVIRSTWPPTCRSPKDRAASKLPASSKISVCVAPPSMV